MSGVTVVLGDEGSEEAAEKVIASSRKLYAKKHVEPKSDTTDNAASAGKKNNKKLPKAKQNQTEFKIPTKKKKKSKKPKSRGTK